MLLRSVGLRGAGAVTPGPPGGSGTDFSDYAAGVQPSDWTARGVTTDPWSVIQEAGGYMGSAFLTCDKSSGASPRMLTWDEVPGVDPDIEALALVRLID